MRLFKEIDTFITIYLIFFCYISLIITLSSYVSERLILTFPHKIPTERVMKPSDV